jgi:hypothetical protein
MQTEMQHSRRNQGNDDKGHAKTDALIDQFGPLGKTAIDRRTMAKAAAPHKRYLS